MNQWNNFNVTVLYKTTWKVKVIFWSPSAKEYSKTLEEKKQNQNKEQTHTHAPV